MFKMKSEYQALCYIGFYLLIICSTTEALRNDYDEEYPLTRRERIYINRDYTGPMQCGQNKYNWAWPATPFIINGTDIDAGEFPFQAPVARSSGIIIDERHVLTAAHVLDGCDEKEEGWVGVYYGCHIKKIPYLNRRGCKTTRSYKFKSHENYICEDEVQHPNDIGIVRLQTPMKFRFTRRHHGNINSVCLPDKDTQYKPGDVVIATGWMSNEDWQQKMELTIMDDAECERRAKEYNYTIDMNIHICAERAQNQSTYFGDSGSAVVRRRNDTRFELVGIISSSMGYTPTEGPVILTKVSVYIDWINKWRNSDDSEWPIRKGTPAREFHRRKPHTKTSHNNCD